MDRVELSVGSFELSIGSAFSAIEVAVVCARPTLDRLLGRCVLFVFACGDSCCKLVTLKGDFFPSSSGLGCVHAQRSTVLAAHS